MPSLRSGIIVRGHYRAQLSHSQSFIALYVIICHLIREKSDITELVSGNYIKTGHGLGTA